jgi:hypothetical protein
VGEILTGLPANEMMASEMMDSEMMPAGFAEKAGQNGS